MTNLDQYLDQIERTAEGVMEGRRKAQDELSSLEQMAVELYVSGYAVAHDKDAYLRALSMALVRALRGNEPWSNMNQI